MIEPQNIQKQPNAPKVAGQDQSQISSPRAEKLLKAAITLLYDEHFEAMVKMFKQYGDEKFPDAMAIAINGTLDRLEKDVGELTTEEAAQVGVGLFEALLEDMLTGGVVSQVTPQAAAQTIQKTIAMWVQKNGDRVDPKQSVDTLNNYYRSIGNG